MGSAKKILIVDDEEDLCLLMKIYFTRKQYEVSIANTLQEGLSKLESLHPDVLFLDNNLPDGLGWEHAPEILEKHPQLELHLISAFHPNIPQNVDRARLRIMEKPFTQQQLNELGL
jgi:DNA-binding NtrC family response regulator